MPAVWFQRTIVLVAVLFLSPALARTAPFGKWEVKGKINPRTFDEHGNEVQQSMLGCNLKKVDLNRTIDELTTRRVRDEGWDDALKPYRLVLKESFAPDSWTPISLSEDGDGLVFLATDRFVISCAKVEGEGAARYRTCRSVHGFRPLKVGVEEFRLTDAAVVGLSSDGEYTIAAVGEKPDTSFRMARGRVTLENIETGAIQAVCSNSQDDSFRFTDLMPGRYRITVSNPANLEPWARTCQEIDLPPKRNSNEPEEVDLGTLKFFVPPGAENPQVPRAVSFDLQLGDKPKIVRMERNIPLIRPTRLNRIPLNMEPDLEDRRIGPCEAEDLPRVGHRDLLSLADLAPEVHPVPGALGDALSVDGQRAFLSDYTMDGGSYKNNFFGTILGGRGSVDTQQVQEFRILSPTSSAGRGRGPASVNLARPRILGAAPLNSHIPATYRFRSLEPGGQTRTGPDGEATRFSFAGAGDGQCRISPCPYSFFKGIYEKQRLDSDLTDFAPPPPTQTIPRRDRPREFDATTLDLQFKPDFVIADENHFSSSLQYARFGALDFANLFTEEEAERTADRFWFFSTQWTREIGASLENRARFGFAHEQRDTFEAVRNASTGVVLPLLNGDATDRYQHYQVGNTTRFVGDNHLLSWGGEWIWSRSRREGRLLPDETRELVRHPPADLVRNWDAGFFIHEQLRVHHKFQLNFGLRWEGQHFPNPAVPPLETAYGDLLDGKDEFPSDGVLPSQYRQWQPRVGFAWAPDLKTVVRGGAGVFNGRQTMLTQLIALRGTLVAPKFENEDAPREATPDVAVFQRDYRNPRIYSAGLRFERRLGTFVAFAEGRWTKGVRLTRFFDLNRSDNERSGECSDNRGPGYCLPQFGNSALYTDAPSFGGLGEVLVVQSSAKSAYRSLTVGVRKDFALGTVGWMRQPLLNAHYTWSRDEDDDSSENYLYGRPFNRYRLDWDYALSDRDTPHRLQVLFSTNFKGSDEEKTGWKRIHPHSAAIRLRARSGRPASFDPLNPKSSGAPCSADNSPSRVVEGVDCGRNHLRLENSFFSADWRLTFKPHVRWTLNFEMLNLGDRDNLILRQDGLRNPFSLRSLDTPLQWRVTVFYNLSFEF